MSRDVDLNHMAWTRLRLKSQIWQFQTCSLAYFWGLPCIDLIRSKTLCFNLRLDSRLSYSDLHSTFLIWDLTQDSSGDLGLVSLNLGLDLRLACLDSGFDCFDLGTWLWTVFVWGCLLKIISVSSVCCCLHVSIILCVQLDELTD